MRDMDCRPLTDDLRKLLASDRQSRWLAVALAAVRAPRAASQLPVGPRHRALWYTAAHESGCEIRFQGGVV